MKPRLDYIRDGAAIYARSFEIIRAEATSDAAIAQAIELGRGMGKTIIVVRDGRAGAVQSGCCASHSVQLASPASTVQSSGGTW